MALAVKITLYSAGEALKKRSTAARACSTNAVAAAEVGLSECGLPSTVRPEQIEVPLELRLRVDARAGVVEVDLPGCVQAPVLGRPQLLEELVRGAERRVSADESHERAQLVPGLVGRMGGLVARHSSRASRHL